jgi:hypothetical protein
MIAQGKVLGTDPSNPHTVNLAGETATRDFFGGRGVDTSTGRFVCGWTDWAPSAARA